jgi:hypothetical protein
MMEPVWGFTANHPGWVGLWTFRRSQRRKRGKTRFGVGSKKTSAERPASSNP